MRFGPNRRALLYLDASNGKYSYVDLKEIYVNKLGFGHIMKLFVTTKDPQYILC